MEMKKLFVLLIIAYPIITCIKGQILHTEYFNVVLDTTQIVKGNFVPSIRYRNVKEKFTEVENTADISIRLGQNGITIGNKLEYARFGNEDIMSGGFVYLEYQRVTNSNKLVFEPYGLMLWQEIRGLDMKYAGGGNLRWEFLHQKNMGLFAGIGSFYEFERWNYGGTSDSTLIPVNPQPFEVENVRGQLYFSYKQLIGDLFDLNISGYFQPSFTSSNYRLASSSQLTYNINRFIGLTIIYQNIYDPDPIVPIDILFHDFTFGLTLSF